MTYVEQKSGSEAVIEIQSEEVNLVDEQDALDIMANVAYLYDCRKISFVPDLSQALEVLYA